jgi:hypothetical protein
MQEQNFVEKMQAILNTTVPVDGSVPPKPYPRVVLSADVTVRQYHTVDIEVTSEDHDDETCWDQDKADELACSKLDILLDDDVDIDFSTGEIVNQDEIDAWEKEYGDECDSDGDPLD